MLFQHTWIMDRQFITLWVNLIQLHICIHGPARPYLWALRGNLDNWLRDPGLRGLWLRTNFWKLYILQDGRTLLNRNLVCFYDRGERKVLRLASLRRRQRQDRRNRERRLGRNWHFRWSERTSEIPEQHPHLVGTSSHEHLARCSRSTWISFKRTFVWMCF